MDTTDDGFEPVGEAPELTMPRVTRLVDQQARIIAEVTALHEHMYDGPAVDAWEYCGHCATTWPCETMRIFERVAL